MDKITNLVMNDRYREKENISVPTKKHDDSEWQEIRRYRRSTLQPSAQH